MHPHSRSPSRLRPLSARSRSGSAKGARVRAGSSGSSGGSGGSGGGGGIDVVVPCPAIETPPVRCNHLFRPDHAHTHTHTHTQTHTRTHTNTHKHTHEHAHASPVDFGVQVSRPTSGRFHAVLAPKSPNARPQDQNAGVQPVVSTFTFVLRENGLGFPSFRFRVFAHPPSLSHSLGLTCLCLLLPHYCIMQQ